MYSQKAADKREGKWREGKENEQRRAEWTTGISEAM